MRTANKSSKRPYFALVRKMEVIWNLYLGPEPHQELVSSSNWSAQS